MCRRRLDAEARRATWSSRACVAVSGCRLSRLLLHLHLLLVPLGHAAGDATPAPMYAFTVRADLAVGSEAGWFDTAHLLVLQSAETPVLRLEVRRNRLRLTQYDGGRLRRLWQQRVRLTPGPHRLLLKQRSGQLALCLDACQLTTQAVRIAAKPIVKFEPADGLSLVGRPRVQRIGRITFGDDFAREGTAAQQWETASGQFALSTSLNPSSSQSAFQLWARAPEGAGMAVADNSYWFWDNYRFGVSAKAAELPSNWGLVFHYVDPQTYHLLRWSQPADGKGVIQLVRVRAGQDRVLTEHPLSMRPGQWYRATIVALGTEVRAFIDGTEVGRALDVHLTGGRIGLFLQRAADVYFDDVSAESVGQEALEPGWQLPNPFGPCEQPWSDFSHKRFITDQYMIQWSHPRSFWRRGSADSPLNWFRPRFFHDVSFVWERGSRMPCHWPAQSAQVVLLADPERAMTGYGLRLSGQKVMLSKGERAIAEAPVDASTLDSLKFQADAGRVTCDVNGAEVLTWVDPEPLVDGFVGADLGRTYGNRLRWPDWRDTARIESSRRLDYNFGSAPTAWAAQSGVWSGTHRWACVPRWSFFGGRGTAGAPGVTHGNAILWNLRRFTGDFDVELFLAPLEGTPQRVHFSWPVWLNIAFAADGRSLDSGYLFLFGTYDVPSRLYRAGSEVATNSSRVLPNIRVEPMNLYHRVTQVWQHVRIQRRASKILIDAARHDANGNYLGLERTLEFDDPEPLTGERIGLWTWGANGMAISRATVSFASSPGAASPADVPVPSPGGVAVLSMRGGAGEPDRYQRIQNTDSGGVFAHDLITGPVDVSSTGHIEFDYRVSADAVLSLLASIRGQTAEVVVTGPERYRVHTIPLGRLGDVTGRHSGAWHRGQFDFLTALRRVFPEGRLIIDRLVLASPCETVEAIAGLNVNRYGWHYDLTQPAWRRSQARPPAPVLPLTPSVLIHGVEPVDDFESNVSGWSELGGRDGAVLYRDPQEPAAGRYSLRLLNQEVAGPAGAWVCRSPYRASCFPAVAFHYRVPQGIEVNLVLRANGQWFEVELTGNDASWPVLGRFPDVQADGRWHRAEFELYDALRRRLRTDDVQIQALAFADSARMSSRQRSAYWIDDFCRIPAVWQGQPTEIQLCWELGGSIQGHSYVVDDAPGTCPKEARTGGGHTFEVTGDEKKGRFLHVRAQGADGAWSQTLHLRLNSRTPPAAASRDTTARVEPAAAPPPPAPFVSYIPSDSLCRDEFEWQRTPEFPAQRSGEFCIRRAAWVLRTDTDAATGEGSVGILNLAPAGFFSGYLRKSTWDPERWPRVAFDYKFDQPGCALNLSMLVNGAMTIVEWTGRNSPGNYFHDSVVGRTGPAEQDRRWHHVEFDLYEMLLAKRFTNPRIRSRLLVTELSTWATSHNRGGAYVNPLGAIVKFDNFTVYSPRGRSPGFEWRLHDWEGGEAEYSYAFDQAQSTIPPQRAMARRTSVRFNAVEPGVWFFHVRAVSPDQRWGETAHRQIEILP